MNSAERLLEHAADEGVEVLTKLNRDAAASLSLPRAMDDAISRVWPTRKNRITHDMVASNFLHLVTKVLVYMQIILLLHGLEAVGRNWDHLASIDKIFLPTFVQFGVYLFIVFVSFIWACFSFTAEGGDSRLLEYDELHRLWRLFYHLFPLIFYGLELLFIYSIIHCHLNNAHRDQGLCKAFDTERITGVLALVVVANILHRVLNFYQIFKHTQRPTRRKIFNSGMGGANVPLLSGNANTRVPTASLQPTARLARVPSGMGQVPIPGSTVPTLPNTGQFPDTDASNYAFPETSYEAAAGSI